MKIKCKRERKKKIKSHSRETKKLVITNKLCTTKVRLYSTTKKKANSMEQQKIYLPDTIHYGFFFY